MLNANIEATSHRMHLRVAALAIRDLKLHAWLHSTKYVGTNTGQIRIGRLFGVAT